MGVSSSTPGEMLVGIRPGRTPCRKIVSNAGNRFIMKDAGVD